MILKSINLAVAFFLELAMLAAVAYWEFQASDSLPVRLLLGIGAPLIAIVFWAQWMAPKSTKRLKGSAYLLVKFVLFGLAAIPLADCELRDGKLWTPLEPLLADYRKYLAERE